MILNDLNLFPEYISTYRNADVLFVKEWVAIADLTAKARLLGDDVYSHVVALPADDPLRVLCSRFVCHEAYFEAIPNLDLVQTNNGFSVIGKATSGTTPASRDRVASLRAKEDAWREKFRQLIIEALIADSETNALWQPSNAFRQTSQNLYLGFEDFSRYGVYDKAADYRGNLPTIRSLFVERSLFYFSSEYAAELLEKQYTGALNDYDNRVLPLIKMAIGGLLTGNPETATRQLLDVVDLMNENIDKFPTYAESKAYMLKRSENYENKKNHPTFFGGL